MKKSFLLLLLPFAMASVLDSQVWAEGCRAARVTDMTTAGCTIGLGSLNVLIGGLAAAREQDPVNCAFGTGLIISGSTTVFINGLQAARLGDPVMEWTLVGPTPQPMEGTIITGEESVLIGD